MSNKIKEQKPTVVETLYTREEILAQASAFGVRPEVVAGALFSVKSEKMTRKQVEEAIEKFKKKEVK